MPIIRETSTYLSDRRPQVGLACNAEFWDNHVYKDDLDRLKAATDFSYLHTEVKAPESAEYRTPPPRDAAAEAELARFARDLDALIIWEGTPYLSAEVLDGAPGLSIIGDVEGDRFGNRMDVESAWARGLRVLDTAQGASLPTAEWALGLALIGLRNAGTLFRRLVNHTSPYPEYWGGRYFPGFKHAELTGRSVGLIGFGYLGRYLVDFLKPFNVQIRAYDPFCSREVAEAYDVDFCPLNKAMEADVVFGLLPLTVGTRGLIGAEQIAHLQPGAVFVNVGRGPTVDSAALIERLGRDDIVACLDVFDPEPIPLDSPILDLPNIFMTPHIAGSNDSEKRPRCFGMIVDDLLRHFAGVEPRSLLNPNVVALRNKGTAVRAPGASE